MRSKLCRRIAGHNTQFAVRYKMRHCTFVNDSNKYLLIYSFRPENEDQCRQEITTGTLILYKKEGSYR